MRGHFAARLDPLQYLEHAGNERRTWWKSEDTIPDVEKLLRRSSKRSESDLNVFGLGNADPNKQYYLGSEVKVKNKPYWTISSLIESLEQAYCSHVGVEYSHIENDEELFWLESKIEGEYGPSNWNVVSREEKLASLDSLLSTDLTAKFLAEKYPSAKVFGIEGCEVIMPGIRALIREAAAHGAEGIEMGMVC